MCNTPNVQFSMEGGFRQKNSISVVRELFLWRKLAHLKNARRLDRRIVGYTDYLIRYSNNKRWDTSLIRTLPSVLRYAKFKMIICTQFSIHYLPFSLFTLTRFNLSIASLVDSNVVLLRLILQVNMARIQPLLILDANYL